MAETEIHLRFDGGTLLVSGPKLEQLAALPGCQPDPRQGGYRAEARHYRTLVEHLRRERIAYRDEARDYQPASWEVRLGREPFPHQTEALDAWWEKGGRGVVVLPTGTGKTYLAIMAIARTGRPALVVTPTIDLLNQWYDELITAFAVPVGLMGGGSYDIQPLTVTTYDSAYIHLERWGNRFGLVVFDECHHLPGPTYLTTAVGSIAPYRLGLTATPERADGQEVLLPELIGPIVYRREIKQLAGDFLAEYHIERRYVELSAEEQEQYRRARDLYRRFVEERGISMGGPGGWQRFLRESFRSPDGRAAFQAYREQKRLALAAPAKLQFLEGLLDQHRADRILIFTYDNATVYQIARRFLIPAITHQTKTKERRAILQRFHCGDYPIVVTSQVLNEGVDVPSASVGVVLSGTGSVREHVQRLGRLLRKYGEKQAVLYEVVTRGTAEEFTSERRRQHHAYR
ncbi:MAG TPA: DEAD/DEAH box helicase family protein [Gemmataceae bacterium]|nr:DEAD/DEAH box helicase family protein [Gemmataceae bacterium]